MAQWIFKCLIPSHSKGSPHSIGWSLSKLKACDFEPTAVWVCSAWTLRILSDCGSKRVQKGGDPVLCCCFFFLPRQHICVADFFCHPWLHGWLCQFLQPLWTLLVILSPLEQPLHGFHNTSLGFTQPCWEPLPSLLH